MKAINFILVLFAAVAFGVQISDVTDIADGESMNMNPRKSWVQKDVSNFYDITKSKDDMLAYSGKRGIKGCVMVNRYEMRPEWLIMTCRGEGLREPNNQGGLIVFDVSRDGMHFVLDKPGKACKGGDELKGFHGPNDMSLEDCAQECKNDRRCTHFSRWTDGGCGTFSGCSSTRRENHADTFVLREFEGSVNNAAEPRYVNHWHGTTSVEGQAAHGNHLFTVDMEGKLQVFKDFFSTTWTDSEIKPTAEIQSTSRILSHLTTWVDPSSGKLYGIATTGYSWSWPEQTCETKENVDIFRCGAAEKAASSFEWEFDFSEPDDHFDGVVIFDLSNLDKPTQVNSLCVKSKCPHGVSVFFDESNHVYAAIGGVDSAALEFLDISDPEGDVGALSEAKEHLNHLVPFYGIHPDTPGYETFSNSGVSGGISVWNVKNPNGEAKEAAQLDELECSFANGAIFWNERYLLTPLASPIYGGACLYDMCEVNKPRFRSYVHFETLSLLTGGDARTTYGMNAYDDYAYFLLGHQNEMYTMEIDLEKVYNHVVDNNRDIEYYEVEPVYLNGYNATTCDVGEEYSEAERMNIVIIAAAVGAVVVLCCACCCCLLCCCRGGNAGAGKQGIQMAGAGAAATGGVIMVQQAPEAACGCCCFWDKMCDIMECCFIMNILCGGD